MPVYKCDTCGLVDDEAVPCPACKRMLLPVKEDKTQRIETPKAAPKAAPKAVKK